jgi:uncharacterized membrane protein SpoIIM required for sporulation
VGIINLKIKNMKTFGLFMILFLAFTIGLSLGLPKDWTVPQIMLQSTLLAYIMQQYLVDKIDKDE